MSGEKESYRRAMDRMAKQMVDNGARPEHAIKKAREAAIRKDRKDSNKQ